MRNPARRALAIAATLSATLVVLCVGGAASSLAAVSASYPNTVFSDNFESGNLGAWTGQPGNSLATVITGAAHAGTYGLETNPALGQFTVLAKALPQTIVNSSTQFALRVNSLTGSETIAQARDANWGGHVWDLYYDAGGRRLILYPYGPNGSTEIDTDNGSVPLGQWVTVEVRYDANPAGGARVYVNGATQPAWGVDGDYTRSPNYGVVQLWNDAVGETQFDDVRVAAAAAVPGAPTALAGSTGNGSVTLNWTAPTDNGGSAITSYRITPYLNGVAQASIDTGTTATTRTVSGLTNGTAYTFTVAATNAVGTGSPSAATPPLTPRSSATVPGVPTAVAGTPGDRSIALQWAAPVNDGGSAITSYRIVPSINGVAQTPINTGTAALTYTATGLTNGTAYTFTVAAVNGIGAGTQSASAGPFTPNSTGPSDQVFSDDFESGTLSAWNAPEGTGTVVNGTGATVAHSGTRGLSITNTGTQYGLIRRNLGVNVWDTTTRFWLRVGAASGSQTVAQARDGSSGAHMWDLNYDGANQRFSFFPYKETSSAEIDTAPGSARVGTWMEIQVRYTATASGGARLYINGQSDPAWGVTGDFARSAPYRILQLWNDAANTTSFDDVSVLSAPTVPQAPTAATGVTGSAEVTLNWNAPPDDGGRPVTGYRVTPYINGTAQTPILTGSTATQYSVTGLTNDTAYTFTVAAINAVGTGAESVPTRSLTPTAVGLPPGAPSGVSGTAGDRSVALTWTAPTSDGGRTITGYRITPYVNGVAQTGVDTGGPGTSYTVMGLANGSAYTFTVAAENAAGTGTPSSPSTALTPSFVGPTNVVFADGFESGDTSAWTSTPGTGYVSVSSEEDAAHSGTSGLEMSNVLGQYAILQKALAASIVDSATRFWVKIGANSGMQTVAQGRDGSSSARMWELWYDAANQRFVLYAYRSTGSLEIDTPAGSAPRSTWMEVKVRYSASVTGTARIYINGQTQPGWGVNADFSRTTNFQVLQLWDDAPNIVRFDDVQIASDPSTRPGGVTAPVAPTNVNATRGDGSATLTWTAPADDGGNAITGYRITPTTSGTAQTPVLTGSSATNFRVPGLTNGATYTFAVAAINAVGTSPDSAASNAVIPRADTAPDVPTAVTAAAGDGSATLDWTAPADTGGQPISGYRVTPYVGTTAGTPVLTGSSSTHAVINNLTNGTAYTFRVAATNSVGTGADSTDSNAVTPHAPTAPGAPTALAGTAGDTRVTLTWRAPADDGGRAISTYRVTTYRAGAAQGTVDTGGTGTRYTVTGLTNNTAYTFTVAAVNAIGTGTSSAASDPLTPVPNPPNAIVLENQKPGTTSWLFSDSAKAENHQIEGYASATSVNKGDSINLKVNLSSAAQYTIDVYRMGWYPTGTNPDGTSCAPSCGGRLMQHIGPLNGVHQPNCPTNTTSTSPDYGMIECNWSTSYALSIPTSWTSGDYIVKLTRLDGTIHYENYMTFAVRDDSSQAPIVYSLDTSTWQAYNGWGGSGNNNVGISLYGRVNDVTGNDVAGSRAYTVSYDRPYYDNGAADGAGAFMIWDYPLVRWMEAQGYNMTYVTSTDLESDPGLLTGHKVFVNAGHDEYYSDNMRSRLISSLNGGLNLALFSANNFYYRIVWSADGAGAPLRRIHTDKGAQTGLATVEWRNVVPAKPENQIGGVMLNGVSNSRDFLVADATSWIYQGTGLKTYTGNGTNGVLTSGPNQNALPAIIGYEFDERTSNSSALTPWASFDPPGLATVGHSFVPASDNGVNAWSDAVLHTVPGGGTVFAAGTMQWSFGVDDGVPDGYCDCGHSATNPATQRVTKNILDRFSGG